MKYMSQETLDRLIETCNSPDAKNKRDAVMIRLVADLGLRGIEVRNISTKDIDFIKKILFIKTAKRGVSRAFPAPAYLLNYARNIDGQLFSMSKQRFWQIWQAWRPGDYTAHALRHTFAMRLFKKKKDIRKVQKALGHKSLNSTAVYLDETYSIEDMKKDLGIK